MGERRKRTLPVPPSLISPMLTIEPVLEVEIAIPAVPRPTRADDSIIQGVRETSAKMWEQSLEELRKEGVTEEQLADFGGALRLQLLLHLLDLDLDAVALRFFETGGATLSVSATIATHLLPEIGEHL